MSEYVLEIEGLIKDYRSLRAVDNLSVKVEKGSIFGILGPNGSGKSTTLGVITRVINATAGSFRWFGENDHHSQLKKVGVLLERPNFYGYMNALDNLKIVAAIRGYGSDMIEEVLEFVKLYERRKSRFSTYSFGMQQRLAIASALLGNPEVLILDEPTNGLDPEGIAEIREMILKIADSGKTILLASHLLDEVQKVCSDVLILKKGKKIYTGPVEGIGGDVVKYRLKSRDLQQLKEAVVTYPKVEEAGDGPGWVWVKMKPGTDAAGLNAYLMEYGISLSLLAPEKANLEDQFIRLLKNDAQ